VGGNKNLSEWAGGESTPPSVYHPHMNYLFWDRYGRAGCPCALEEADQLSTCRGRYWQTSWMMSTKSTHTILVMF